MAEVVSHMRSCPDRQSLVQDHAIETRRIRADIQGLRAVAVLSVLLFHIWPDFIPGGFVGVDVFFVISGYLITGILFRELQQTGGISLWRFYARRMKRLLPAASLVLVAVAVLTTPLLPPPRWEDTAIEILASAFYLENWRLAWLAVDYLGAENAASPVQHFWSLSIEEQFYIGWPLLMLAGGAIARRVGNPRTAVMVPLLLVVAASLGASIWLTHASREAAYFLTHTRIWELGIGAVLAIAVLPDLPPRMRETMRTAGLAAIVASAMGYSAGTAFPGYAALLPVLGCAMVIAAGSSQSGEWSAQRLLASPPAQYLGDMSYSIYLWHWPLVVFAGLHAPGGIGLSLGGALLTATLAIAYLSKRFVEDPIRYATISTGKALAFSGGFIALCIVGAMTIYHYFAVGMMSTHVDLRNYPGANAIFTGAIVPSVDAPMPPLMLLRKDKSETYRSNCHVSSEDAELNPCQYGPVSAPVKVVLIGDSHAANWAPSLIQQADELGWRVEINTKSACLFSKELIPQKDGLYLSCAEWSKNLLKRLRETHPDIVVIAQLGTYRLANDTGQEPAKQVAGAVADVWRDLLASGIKVVAIRDTPQLPFDPGECVARDPKCFAEQAGALRGDDPLLMAHALLPEVPVIDMTDAVCRDARCPMVVGNVIVWRDTGHLTASYARTLGAVLTTRITKAASEASPR